MVLKQKLLTLFILFISINVAFSQLTDLARLEYSFIPKTKSEDRYTRFRVFLNYPIKFNETDYFIIGGEYNNINLDLREDYPFDVNLLSELHVIDFNLGYTFKSSKEAKWRWGVNITPRIASTLNSKVNSNDCFINGGIYAIRDKTKDQNVKKPNRLVVGLSYNTTAGIPFPLPFVNYFRELNKHWTYSLGVPKSNIKYRFNDKHVIQAFTSLDGYFANIQRQITLDGVQNQSTSISLSVAVAGLGYEYFLTKHLVAYTYTGFTFLFNNALRDDNRDEIFKLDELNAFYLRTGIRFKI